MSGVFFYRSRSDAPTCGRTLTVIKPDGASTTHYLYQANTTKVTDPAGKWKTFTNNASGNLVTVTEPDPNNAPNGTMATSYTYNGLNQLIGVSMPRNLTTGGQYTQTRSFQWTGADLTSSTNPENGTVTYQYDGNHHVTQRTDAKQQQTRYTYDTYSRLTAVRHYVWDSSSQQLNAVPSQDVNYYYDVNTLIANFSQNTWGRLAAVTFNGIWDGSSPSAYYYSYNTAGRVTAQRYYLSSVPGSNPATPWTFDAAYAWDNQGRMTSQTYPGGNHSYGYQYDPMGRLSAITQSDCAIYNSDGSCDTGQNPNVANANYSFAGQLTSLNYNGVTETRGYDSLLRLTSINTGSLLGVQYNYSATADNGRITSTVDSGETVSYTYDQLNRLATATASGGAWSQQYSYDGFGNLTGTNGSTTWSADPATNRYGSTDANGNAQMPVPPYSTNWDVENRMMTGVGPLGVPLTYAYDPLGKRILQTATSIDENGSNVYETQVYIYSVSGQKLQAYTCDANHNDPTTCFLNKTNVYFGRKLITINGAQAATDRLGSVRGMANTTNPQMSYYPYGQERVQSNGQTTPDNTEKFGTYFRDGVGQDYADQRYYNQSGRFFSPDPGGIRTANSSDPGSWNRYSYTQGDPINGRDPRGLVTSKTCTDDSDDPSCWTNPCDPGWGEGFMPLPNPGCYGGGGDPGPATPTTRSAPDEGPQCDVKLESSSLNLGITHTFLVLSMTDPGSGVTTDKTLEGLPIPKNGSWSFPKFLLGGYTLNAFLTPGARAGTQVYDFSKEYTNEELCSDIAALTTAAYDYKKYKDNMITYNFLVGPNSNTFTAYMLGQAGMVLPPGIASSLFFSAPGFYSLMP